MNLYNCLANGIVIYIFLLYFSQHFKPTTSINYPVDSGLVVADQIVKRYKRSKYQPISEIRTMTFKRAKANLEEKTIVASSDSFK